MERLEMNNAYSALETSIHLARYSISKQFCKNKKVLDAACGEGYGTYLLKKWGASEVTGIDISEEAIEKAKENFQIENVEYLKKDLTDLHDIEDSSFDLIVSFETIEHIEKPEIFLKELKRLINKNGTIILTCPNDYFYYKNDESNIFHKRKYTFEDFKKMLTDTLGQKVKFYKGMHCNGFINFDDLSQNMVNQKDMIKIKCNNIECYGIEPQKKVDFNNANYYIAIWNNQNFESSAILYPNNDNSDIDVLINELKKENEVQCQRYEDENEKLLQLNEAMKIQIDELKKFNLIKEDENNNLIYSYNNLYNSKGYKFIRKIKKIVGRK